MLYYIATVRDDLRAENIFSAGWGGGGVAAVNVGRVLLSKWGTTNAGKRR